MTKAESFFELSHESRQKILELALDEPKKHSDFTRALKIAPAEVTRHLQRLVNSQYLIKDTESRFVITNYGRLLYQQLETLEFINVNSKFFDINDFSIIPKELLSYAIMKEANILKGPMKVFEKIFQITIEAEDIVSCILPEPIDPLIIEHSQQLTRGLEMRLIFQEGNRVPTEYSDHRRMSLEIREMSEVPISIVISEKEAIIILQDVNRKLGYGYGLTGTEKEFLRWCWLLFDHYWMLGNEIVF